MLCVGGWVGQRVYTSKINRYVVHLMDVRGRCTPTQLATMHQAAGELEKAVDWLQRLCSCAPHDAGVMARLGALHARYDYVIHGARTQ